MKKFIISLVLVLTVVFSAKSQLVITPDTNTIQLVNDFILSGVTASNVQYTGALFTLGTFNNGFTTDLGLADGIVMTTGTIDTVTNPSIGSPVSEFACFFNNVDGDSLLENLIPGYLTYDASVLEFDLIPVGNTLEFQYVFGSEEYPEFVGSSFNDVFGFFISGDNPSGGLYVNENIALLPGNNIPVSINNVNADSNSTYFIDNQGLNGQTIVFDGFTTVLTAQISVIPSTPYHLKMAIADAGDGAYDSGIFLKAQSMKSYSPVGITEQKNYNSSIFPNPLNENSVLTFNTQTNGITHVYVSDCMGRILDNSSEKAQSGTFSYPIGRILNHYHTGIYFINIQTPDKSWVERVVN